MSLSFLPEVSSGTFMQIMPLIAAIGVVVGLVALYSNYRKSKKVDDTKQGTHVSQTNTGASNIDLTNCTININKTPVEKFGEAETLAEVKKCLETHVPEIVGTISKGVEVTLDKYELSLVDAVKEKVEQYKKTKNELLKDSGILTTLGNEAYYLGQMDNALEYFKEALEIDEELKDKRGKATDLNNIGIVYQNWGKPEKALEYYKEALEIDEELKDKRGKATRLNNIGSLYYDWGKPEKALEYFKEALEINEELKDKRGKATCLNNIGLVYQNWGKPEKALEYFKEALEIAEELKDKQGKATRLNNIGLVYQNWGKPEKALEYYKEALEINEELKDKRGKATCLNNIGLVYQNWGKPEKALEYFKESLAIFEELMDVRSAETVKENIRSITRQKHQ
ncbi:MAG: hypothetical protein AEth_00255 [Candidatus Argoarchaeum ethanivorans]|uniref:UDP-N-acetylglucosamine--peptide N-acetylglucosaminyltransferase SPINDLY n=1 Tax=Candidatus Argoarchaeum ethanivorans TaxID=2608793 RepID=A0A8B3S6Y8_9EURY|nr:MAG: hypothetical protein AEth_00255 [Candidatus Argoarchaeum ethanivorans]